MSGLSNEECELLGDWWNDGSESDLDWDLSTLIPVLARIKRSAVNEALTEAAEAIEDARSSHVYLCSCTECRISERAARTVRARTT